MPHCTLSSWTQSPSLRLQRKVVVARKQDYYINEQLAYSLHVVCDFRAKLVGVVKKKILL